MNNYVFKPYNKAFPQLFKKEKERITSCIQANLMIEHVGSTAVPGLEGKGIIDIAVAAETKEFDSISKKLQDLGYTLRLLWSTPDRLFFRADLPDLQEGIRRYHVHLTHEESQDWKGLIAFRDYLRSHPEDAENYAELKKKAATEVKEDGEKYRKLKDPFFKEILAKAMRNR